MKQHTNWLQVLIQCKDNIHEQIAPLLKTLDQPQPDLGTGAGGDPMRQIDIAAEKAIVNTFRQREISFTLISEETGVKEFGRTPHRCYVTADPIDGTTNLMRELPFYATSIAVSTEPTLSNVHTALVADLFHDMTYTAQKGTGACRNGQKIVPSKNSSLQEAVIGMDLNGIKVHKITSRLIALLQETKHIRHFGANALELCYVADGKTDAFIDIRGKLRATDMAAAWLIIKEAGAIMTTQDGKQLDVKLHPRQKVEFVAAANHTMHKLVLELMTSKREEK